jgi:hypothetical protein
MQMGHCGHGRKMRKVLAQSMDNMANGKGQNTLNIPPQRFEKKFFIHARHTCDGCSKSPIIGTRYHATKIPDFDLCTACYEKYEGEDLDFKPEIHERDRQMQKRWLKKQLNNSNKVPGHVVDMWSGANGNLADFLKKVQESGATIETATVYASSPPKESAPASEAKTSEEPSPDNMDADATEPSKETQKPVEAESVPPAEPKEDMESVKTEPRSPSASNDESFLTDADGSIAEAIGRTLDVCVAAIEEAMVDVAKDASVSTENNKAESPESQKDDADAAVVDTFSVASSLASSMTEVLKKMEEAKVADAASQTAASQPSDAPDASSSGVPSMVTGASIVKSVNSGEKEEDVEMVAAEEVSEDEWSVVEEGKGDNKKDDDQSVLSELSPILLAKWDTELHQLHELGFLDDRKNVDVLEALEASHVGVDSTEKVTINAALGRLLGDR